WSAAELGAGMLMVNPLHATSPVAPIQPSPYYPSSRRYRNPLYLRIEDVAGAEEASCQIGRLAEMARELNKHRRIDRDRVFGLKMEALECIWRSARHDDAFDAYCQREGRDLERFGLFCALAERLHGGWQNWPVQFHDPDSPAVRSFFREHID